MTLGSLKFWQRKPVQKPRKKSWFEKHDEQSREKLLDSLFEDYNKRRRTVYKINFFRGIWFGLGSAIGGSIILAILVWLSTQLIDFPLLGNFIQTIIDAGQQVH